MCVCVNSFYVYRNCKLKYMQHTTTIYHRLRLIASAVNKDFNLRLAKNKANIYQVNAKIMQCHVLLCKKVTFTFHVKHKQ